MTLHEIYNLCRDINRWLAAGAFLWVTWRTVRAWPADWAKPNHVGHYRSILTLISGCMLTLTMGAFLLARAGTQASLGSAIATVMCVGCILICAWWPRPRSMRKD